MKKNNLKNKKIPFFLIGIFLFLIYHKWILGSCILTHGDWLFYFRETLETIRINYFNLWLNDIGFGRILFDVAQAPTYSLYGLIAKLTHLNYSIIERIVHFWPIIILVPISSYILLNKILKNNIAIFIGILVYSFNTYFLTLQTGHITLMAAFSFAPLILYIYIINLEKSFIRTVIYIGLLLFMSSAYEPRVFYIIIWLLFLYFLYYLFFINKTFEYKNIFTKCFFGFVPILIFTLLSFYWIFSLAKIGSITSNELFNRGLFGSQYFNIIYSITLFHPWWTGNKIAVFITQPVPLHFWLIPVFAFLGLWLNRKNKNILFFGFIALLGILLTKQVGEPFTNLYLWLYSNLPGFNAFREASKFYFLIALGYSVLIGAFINWLWENWKEKKWQIYSKYILTVGIAFIFLWNTKPLITGEIGTLFVPRHIPNDYLVLKDFILNQPEYFRTFWTPRDSRWGIYVNNHPKISNIDIIQTKWEDIADYKEDNILPIQERIMKTFKYSYSDNLFDIGSIKYVVVPLQDIENDDDFYIHYGGRENENIRDYYIQELDKIDYLEKIDIDTKDLVVYENKNYKSHIFLLNNIYSFNSINNLDQKYNFINDQLENEFNFIVNDEQYHNKLICLNSLFEEIDQSNINDQKIKYNVDLINNNNLIYINTAKTDLYYSVEDNKIVFYTDQEEGLFLKNKNINVKSNDGKNVLYQSSFDLDKKYYIDFGIQLILVQKDEKIKLSSIGDNIVLKLYSTNNKNFIPNASFQEGLWDKKVGDCNAYDDNPVLDMKIEIIDTDNDDQCLQLEAIRHIACTTNKFSLQENLEYLFSFDYQGIDTKKAGYYLSFDNEEKTVIRGGINIDNQEWNYFERYIRIPSGANSAKLYVYAYGSDGIKNNIVRYDNFSLVKLDLEKEIKIDYEQKFEKKEIELAENNTFEYIDSYYNYKNVILNGSFENGLWGENVGDCNSYDDNPKLAMRINNDSVSEGKNSLQLEATRHIACANTAFAIKEDTDYLFSFGYQSPNAKTAGYYLQFNNKDKAIISERIDIEDQDWQEFTKKIKTPMGVSSARLYVYAYESDKKTNNIVRYDNFQFIELPDLEDKYYLVSDPQLNLKKPRSVEFEMINPTKKIVHIKGAETSFFLAMSESYHDQWQLQMNNEKVQGVLNKWWPFAKQDKVKDEYHYKLNGFLNAWYVDTEKLCKNNNTACKQNPDGTYDLEMIIEFYPQRWFYLGLLISGLTLLSCVFYLIYDFLKTKIWRKK